MEGLIIGVSNTEVKIKMSMLKKKTRKQSQNKAGC